VLERYLLLLSLEVEAQRMLEEHHRQIAEIDRAHAELRAKRAAEAAS
jgi:hypothetical protein